MRRPVADRTARRTLLDVWGMSVNAAEAARDTNGDVRVFHTERDMSKVALLGVSFGSVHPLML